MKSGDFVTLGLFKNPLFSFTMFFKQFISESSTWVLLLLFHWTLSESMLSTTPHNVMSFHQNSFSSFYRGPFLALNDFEPSHITNNILWIFSYIAIFFPPLNHFFSFFLQPCSFLHHHESTSSGQRGTETRNHYMILLIKPSIMHCSHTQTQN